MVRAAQADARDAVEDIIVGGEGSGGPHIDVAAVYEVTCRNMHRVNWPVATDGSSICNNIPNTTQC